MSLASIAQLVEQTALNRRVPGSIPGGGTMWQQASQTSRASAGKSLCSVASNVNQTRRKTACSGEIAGRCAQPVGEWGSGRGCGGTWLSRSWRVPSHARIAQLVERLAYTQNVGSSSLSACTQRMTEGFDSLRIHSAGPPRVLDVRPPGSETPGRPRRQTRRPVKDRPTPAAPGKTWCATVCGCSSVGRASDFQSGCRGFDPRHPLSPRPMWGHDLR